MATISITNMNKPTSPFWGKIAAACAFISGTITMNALYKDIHWIGYISSALTLFGGLILIFVDTPQSTSTDKVTPV